MKHTFNIYITISVIDYIVNLMHVNQDWNNFEKPTNTKQKTEKINCIFSSIRV
jgi:hypothetical protein